MPIRKDNSFLPISKSQFVLIYSPFEIRNHFVGTSNFQCQNFTRFWNEIFILLQEMRDRLKEKHKKNDMVKLKKQLQFGGDFGASFDSGFKMKGVAVTGAASSDFFDD